MRPRYQGVPDQIKSGTLAPPMKGMNSLDALMNGSPEQCIYMYNMIPAQYGLNVRTGYKEWATNVVGTGGVRTIIPIRGFQSSQDRLFAVSSDGIYEVTASTAAPTKRQDYPTKTGDAGWSQWTSFTTTAGQFTVICDEVNGYYYFDPVANTFTKPTAGAGAGQINGVDPALFAYAISYKGRLWFIEQNSSRAWYLPVGQLTGTVTLFDFGNKFIFGGALAALYPFTINGGVGAEDYLVAISTAGDVVVYLGTDPSSSATWDQKGIWYIGDLPKGRRIADIYGGDLLLISVYGVLPLSKLMSGVDLGDEASFRSRNVSNFINSDMLTLRTTRGWEIKSFPKDNLLILSTPKVTGVSYKQYVQNTSTEGWGIYRDFPYQTAEIWTGDLYVGTSDGRVLLHTGTVDGTTLAGTGSVQINWSMLTVYQGSATQKIPSMVRPYFLGQLPPAYACKILFDFDINEPILSLSSSFLTGSVWDTGAWDSGVWGGANSATQSVYGTSGIGQNLAIALQGSSIADTRLMGFDIAFMEGGFM